MSLSRAVSCLTFTPELQLELVAGDGGADDHARRGGSRPGARRGRTRACGPGPRRRPCRRPGPRCAGAAPSGGSFHGEPAAPGGRSMASCWASTGSAGDRRLGRAPSVRGRAGAAVLGAGVVVLVVERPRRGGRPRRRRRAGRGRSNRRPAEGSAASRRRPAARPAKARTEVWVSTTRPTTAMVPSTRSGAGGGGDRGQRFGRRRGRAGRRPRRARRRPRRRPGDRRRGGAGRTAATSRSNEASTNRAPRCSRSASGSASGSGPRSTAMPAPTRAIGTASLTMPTPAPTAVSTNRPNGPATST